MNDLQQAFQQARERYEALDGRGRATFWAGALGVLMVVVWMFLPRSSQPGVPAVAAAVSEAVPSPKEDAYFLGEAVDRQAYVQRLEGQYFALIEKTKGLEARLDESFDKMKAMAKAQGQGREALAALEGRLSRSIEKCSAGNGPALPSSEGMGRPFDSRHYQLEVINVEPVKAHDARKVHLPAGSFVRATLLTGVYAPSESSNPLPVLIRLNEAFYGPNEVRIPLEGAFAVGKATGELNSERALVQITSISSIFPDGEVFEHKGNIGYLTDTFGQLGLKGVVVHNTGGQLAMSFMTGFMGGASQALADSQTTTVISESGHPSRNLTGSRAKNAGFQGLSQSAAQISRYYDDQLEKIVPAVKVEAGIDVHFIILEGVEVHGLKKTDPGAVRFID